MPSTAAADTTTTPAAAPAPFDVDTGTIIIYDPQRNAPEPADRLGFKIPGARSARRFNCRVPAGIDTALPQSDNFNAYMTPFSSGQYEFNGHLHYRFWYKGGRGDYHAIAGIYRDEFVRAALSVRITRRTLDDLRTKITAAARAGQNLEGYLEQLASAIGGTRDCYDRAIHYCHMRLCDLMVVEGLTGKATEATLNRIDEIRRTDRQLRGMEKLANELNSIAAQMADLLRRAKIGRVIPTARLPFDAAKFNCRTNVSTVNELAVKIRLRHNLLIDALRADLAAAVDVEGLAAFVDKCDGVYAYLQGAIWNENGHDDYAYAVREAVRCLAYEGAANLYKLGGVPSDFHMNTKTDISDRDLERLAADSDWLGIIQREGGRVDGDGRVCFKNAAARAKVVAAILAFDDYKCHGLYIPAPEFFEGDWRRVHNLASWVDEAARCFD